IDVLDQQMIEADLAELVDDDRCFSKIVVDPVPALPCKRGSVNRPGVHRLRRRARRRLEEAIEQRRFARAEKAGQHRKRNGRRGARGVTRRHCSSVLGATGAGGFRAGLVLVPVVAALSLPGKGLPDEGLVPGAAVAGLGWATTVAGGGFAGPGGGRFLAGGAALVA